MDGATGETGPYSATHKKDVMIWKLNQLGQFTTESLYREMIFGGIKDIKLQELWKSSIPLKN